MTIQYLLIIVLIGLAYVFNPYKKTKKLSLKSEVDLVASTSVGYVLGYREGYRACRENKINQFGHIQHSNWYMNNLDKAIQNNSTIKCIDNLTIEANKKLIDDFIKENFLEDDIGNLDVQTLNKFKKLIDDSTKKEEIEYNIKVAIAAASTYVTELIKSLDIHDKDAIQRNTEAFVKYVTMILGQIEHMHKNEKITKESKRHFLDLILLLSQVVDRNHPENDELIEIQKQLENFRNKV